VYIATTNYTERLSERIVSRPNRFDRRIEVRSPNAECRRLYFQHKLKPSDLAVIDMEEWVARTRGMSMAHLGEVIKSVIILGNNFEETIGRLEGMKIIPVSRNYNKEFDERMGFNSSKSEQPIGEYD
jgi:SpoVK/Ycf46/Vps4 family AAA+-type ATPase